MTHYLAIVGQLATGDKVISVHGAPVTAVNAIERATGISFADDQREQLRAGECIYSGMLRFRVYVAPCNCKTPEAHRENVTT